MFLAQEHLRYTHIPNGGTQKKKKKKMLQKVAVILCGKEKQLDSKLQDKYLYLCRSGYAFTKAFSRKKNICLKALPPNGMTFRGWREEADWPFSPLFRDRGDNMMITQPLLALESPLLLLPPPVCVTQVCVHSGFQCWLLPLCSLC